MGYLGKTPARPATTGVSPNRSWGARDIPWLPWIARRVTIVLTAVDVLRYVTGYLVRQLPPASTFGLRSDPGNLCLDVFDVPVS